MTKLQLTPNESYQLGRIKALLDEAENIFSKNFEGARHNEILEIHNEETSLPHALRWGTQAVKEILENHKPQPPGKTCYRKTWIFEAISQTPIQEDIPLEDAISEANTGEFSGHETTLPTQEVDFQEAEATLETHGSLGFFDNPDEEIA